MPKIDLHTHSDFSDGTCTPEEVVHAALKAGVSVYALTDHDTTDGVLRAQKVCGEHRIFFTPGVEISTREHDHLHFTGYNIDLENNSLGAVRDIEMHRWLKDRKIRQEKIDFNNNMGIKDSTKYFNSGVLVMNLKKIRELNSTSKLINITLDKLKTMWVGDQDVLNGFFYKDVKYIDTSWNIEWIVQLKIKDWALEIDEKSYIAYKNALRNPKIIHYCDIYKPWKSPELELASIWWKYARMTDFYEEIIYKNTHNNNYYNTHNNRFSIADFILSFVNYENELSIMFFGIKIKIKKNLLQANNIYYNKKDRIFSIYKNNRYTRITILGIKITIKRR